MRTRPLRLAILLLALVPLGGCVVGVRPGPIGVRAGVFWVPAHWNGWRWIPGHWA